MSKISPLGQSMASLFTPEAERLRSGHANAQGRAGAAAGRAAYKLGKSDKMGDGLGNPNSPGYEHWGNKKNSESTPVGEDPDGPKGPGGTLVHTTKENPEFVRLSAGWEKLLVAQKNICEKAKALFSLLEGPGNYAERRKLTTLKSRGCIVDLDLQLAPEAAMDDEPEKKKGA